MEAQIAAIHQIHDNVSGVVSLASWVLERGSGAIQVFDILEAIAQIAQKRVVQMLEHAALADNVANAFRPYDCDTGSAWLHNS